MSRKEELISEIRKEQVITILRAVDTEKCAAVLEALYLGGIRFVELAYNQSDPSSWKTTAETVEALSVLFKNRMTVGSGTVLTEEQVELSASHGARFIVSPNVNAAVIHKTLSAGLVSIPGAMTPSEILQAWDFGADFVKLFPASDLGLHYFKTIRAPLSHVPLIPTGNIDETNASAFLSAGAAAVAVGGALVRPGAVTEGNYGEITRSARSFLSSIRP